MTKTYERQAIPGGGIEQWETQKHHCDVCGADVRPTVYIRWQDGVWCFDCVTIVRNGGRVTVQARF